VEAVVRDAFEGARRQIDRQTDKQTGQTKRHPHQEVSAMVEQLFHEEGYGFLRTLDGRQIYFHRNSMPHDDFDELQLGTGVTFEATEGDEGLQASTVRVIDSRGGGKT
jgi:cold shock CspA family protein